MITEEKVNVKYNQLIKESFIQLGHKKYEDAYDCIRTACILAKNYYLCYEDDRIEKFITAAGKRFDSESNVDVNETAKERYVFYDTHCTDNVALTQQYLEAIISWNVDFLYITTRDLSSPSRARIKALLDSSGHVSICEISPSLKGDDKIIKIIESVLDYSPSVAFIQTTSDDIEGIIAWSNINSPIKYYIDLSDHSFWLGIHSFDYYIEFRNYGVNICLQHRKIPEKKIIVQPFYPISKSGNYKGLPDLTGKRVLLSGGRLEKIYGQKDQYFKLIQKILNGNKNTVLLFAGGGAFGKSGERIYIEKKWKELGINDKVYMLGFRDDIVEIFKHADLYIGTYPMGGGLMSQIAASQGLPVVQYATDGLSESLGEFIGEAKGLRKFVFLNDERGFLKETSYLLTHGEERLKQGAILRDSIISPNKFSTELYASVHSGKDLYIRKYYAVDCAQRRENQFEVENKCHHSFYRIMIMSNYIKRHYPIQFIYYCLMFFIYSDKHWLWEQIKKRL